MAPYITPALLKAVLTYTARDVTAGVSNAVPPFHLGLPAHPGPDEATGGGLVDAYLAVLTAYWWAATVGVMASSEYLKGLYDPGLYRYWLWPVT